jgi:ATP-dependent Clp protease ATP-binding subunit ClpX
MLDVMFDLPSRDDITKCIITGETVRDQAAPKFVLEDGSTIQEGSKTSA